MKIENRFPSDKGWIEIGQRYNKNGKNIQEVYNIIRMKTEDRLHPRKTKIIEFVIENMLTDEIKAQELAKDELKTARIKS